MQKIEPTDFILEMNEVNKCFPELAFVADKREVVGEMSFWARYVNVGTYKIPIWDIEQCSRSESDNCVRGAYEIKIEFFEDGDVFKAKTFETDGRIMRVAQRLGIKSLSDIHLNQDNSCCLGIFPDTITLSKFIIERVYPYFVWQAWFDKFEKTPPCGECPHDKELALQTRIEEERNRCSLSFGRTTNFKGSERNKLCFCGSGKKYKKCCLLNREKQLLSMMVSKPLKGNNKYLQEAVTPETARRPFSENGGSEGTRTLGLRRDRPAL